MQDFHVILNDVEITLDKLKIDVAVVCGNDGISPKMRINFRRNDEIRRLPLLMRNSFKRSRTNDTVTIFSYVYNISNIFTETNDDKITAEFEIDFGDNCYENIPFFISENVSLKSIDKNINNKFVGGEIFDGITAYGNAEEESASEEENNVLDYTYKFSAQPENKNFIIFAEKNTTKSRRLFKFFSSIAGFITTVLALIGAILLLPFFIIDALFSALNLNKQRKCVETNSFLKLFIVQIKTNIASFIKYALKNNRTAKKIIAFREAMLINYYNRLCKKPVIENRIAFISGRRDELSGNEKFVYDIVKDNKNIDFQFLLSSSLDRSSRNKDKKRFYELYATSKVVIVDDYYNLLNTVTKRDNVTLFQLWHACGAFKTFGFSRLGKPGGPKQTAPDHRMYDYATVSSENIIKFYAEGFGISDKNVLATGVPRTDIFSDEDYAQKVKADFYSRHPKLKDKKIILFAPTFRGNGQNSAYYPIDVFNPNKFFEDTNGEYAILIKLHPFCKEKYVINKKYKDYIIDLSNEDELNDLLFVTDLLITDYSSSVFEASLLNIPMLFFAYDLYQYISERDFYCDFETFVPGKIVFTQEEMTKAIKIEDYESEKIDSFKHKFFKDLDGKSSQRVADAIIKALKS